MLKPNNSPSDALPQKQSNYKIVAKSRWGNWLISLAAMITLLGGGALIVGGAWIGIQLIVNPDAVVWLNRYLPKWTRIPLTLDDPPLTLEQIRSQLHQKDLELGEPLSLSDSETATDLLIPVLAKRPKCQIECEQIVELRVYQHTELNGEKGHYQLVSQLAIAGVDESLVIYDSDRGDSSQLLPLTKLSSFDTQTPDTGIWLNLTGQWQGDTPITYGQILYYNPSQHYLSTMLSWRNPTGKAPAWQEIIGKGTPELVINQTVGMEPKFQVYQLKPRKFVLNPFEFEEIELDQPALLDSLDTQPLKAYRNALVLANNGLWSPAVQILQSIKSQKVWSAAAQAQLDFISLHAQITQSQAKTTWANPSQQIIASLIDGQWEDALSVFQTVTDSQRYQIAMVLKTDPGRLWKRVQAALQVNPTETNVKAWGALITAAKSGLPKAIAWLNEQPQNSSAAISKINQFLDQLDATFAEAPTTAHISQIIGSAEVLTQIDPANWLQPEPNLGALATPLQLEPQQVWYQVQVSNFHDGQRWQKSPFSDLTLSTVAPTKQLWKLLGLDLDSQIQITNWKADGYRETIIATVKAIQIRDGIIKLLAAGEVLPQIDQPDSPSSQKLLANSQTALQWLKPDAVSLSDLNQIQPQWVAAMLPNLWRELQKAGMQPVGRIPSLEKMLEAIGYWSVEPLDLTGNNQPEAVLTLYQNPEGIWKPASYLGDNQMSSQRTLIFSDTGTLIYNEFTRSANTFLLAIAALGNTDSPALVINDSRTYSIKRWSNSKQGFE